MTIWTFIDLHPVLSVIFAVLAALTIIAAAEGLGGRR